MPHPFKPRVGHPADYTLSHLHVTLRALLPSRYCISTVARDGRTKRSCGDTSNVRSPSGVRSLSSLGFGVTRSYRVGGWGSLTLPDILATRAGDRLCRVLLLQGFPANRTVFLPHSLHLMNRLQLGRSKTKLERASFAGPFNFGFPLA